MGAQDTSSMEGWDGKGPLCFWGAEHVYLSRGIESREDVPHAGWEILSRMEGKGDIWKMRRGVTSKISTQTQPPVRRGRESPLVKREHGLGNLQACFSGSAIY